MQIILFSKYADLYRRIGRFTQALGFVSILLFSPDALAASASAVVGVFEAPVGLLVNVIIVGVFSVGLGILFGRKQSGSNEEYLEMHEALKTEMEKKIETLRKEVAALKT